MPEGVKKLAEAMETQAKIMGAIGGSIALIMACVMTAMYGTQLTNFDDDTFICLATRGEGDNVETVDVGEKW